MPRSEPKACEKCGLGLHRYGVMPEKRVKQEPKSSDMHVVQETCIARRRTAYCPIKGETGMVHLRVVQTLLGVATVLTAVTPIEADSLIMSHGWSVNPAGGKAAADEAAALMAQRLEHPKFIVLYTTADYGEQATAQTLRNRFPDAKLFGMNVYRGVFSSDGLHLGKKGSLAIMGFSGADLRLGLCAKAVTDGADVEALARTAVREAAENAGYSLETKPSVILLGATKGKEDAIVRGVHDALGDEIPLVGGTPCNDLFAQGYVIENERMLKPGLIVGLVYTSEVKVGASFYSGFVGKKKSGKITAGDGRLLREIEGRPALEVYRQWAEGRLDSIDCSKQSVLVMSNAVCPLAKAIQLPNGQMRYIPVRPWRFNPDGSLDMGGDIHHGDTIYYVEGNTRALRERAGAVTIEAMVSGRIKTAEVAGGLQIYCAGAVKTLGLGEGDEPAKMVAEIQKAMKHKPFIGGFTAGEQGAIPGYGYFHGNLMSAMVVFSHQPTPGTRVQVATAP